MIPQEMAEEPEGLCQHDEGENARRTLEHSRVVAEEWHGDDELCLHSCITELQAVQITKFVYTKSPLKCALSTPPMVNFPST